MLSAVTMNIGWKFGDKIKSAARYLKSFILFIVKYLDSFIQLYRPELITKYKFKTIKSVNVT